MSKKLLGKLIEKSAGQSKFVMTLIGLSVAIFLIMTALQLQSNYQELLFGKTTKTVWLIFSHQQDPDRSECGSEWFGSGSNQ